MSDHLNSQLPEDFQKFITQQKSVLLREYTRAINRDLAKQNFADLMQRNVLTVMQQFYENAMKHLSQMGTDNVKLLKDVVLKDFTLVFDEFLQAAVKHHHSSCALSNFPEEHHPAADYIAQIIAAEKQLRNRCLEEENILA